MQITSEIVTTPIEITKYVTPELFNERNIHFADPELTNKVMYSKTRYGNVNYYVGDNVIGISLHYYGEYTQYEINLLNNFIHTNAVVYDIGANIGFHTLGFADHAKHVYGFEPNNKNYKLLRMNTGHVKNISTYNVGCSDKNGTAFIQDFEPGSNNNNGELMLAESGQPCDIVKLDDYVKKHHIPDPQVVKIDVEGHEYEVLLGMDKLIRDNLPVIFYEHQTGKLPEIHDYLTGLGYTIYWFASPNFNPHNYKNNQQQIFHPGSGVINALAIPFHITLKTNLPQKLSRDETYNQMVERYMKENAKH